MQRLAPTRSGLAPVAPDSDHRSGHNKAQQKPRNGYRKSAPPQFGQVEERTGIEPAEQRPDEDVDEIGNLWQREFRKGNSFDVNSDSYCFWYVGVTQSYGEENENAVLSVYIRLAL